MKGSENMINQLAQDLIDEMCRFFDFKVFYGSMSSDGQIIFQKAIVRILKKFFKKLMEE
jgi:hypothetical protein